MGNFQVQAPPGGPLYWRGDLTERFLRYEFGGLYLEGLTFGILRYVRMRSGSKRCMIGPRPCADACFHLLTHVLVPMLMR